MAKFPDKLNSPAVDMQVMQQVVNNYKSLAEQLDKNAQEFRAVVFRDLTRLVAEVPGLGDRLRVSDDGYEVMEMEPGDAE